MARLGRRSRAVAAWLVVVLLLAPGSLGARGGCGVCPTDCPMHRVATEPEAHDMPCHRAARAADAPGAVDAGLTVRAACGDIDAGDLVVQLRHRARPTETWAPPASDPPARRSVRAPAAPAADVPTRPPEAVRFA